MDRENRIIQGLIVTALTIAPIAKAAFPKITSAEQFAPKSVTQQPIYPFNDVNPGMDGQTVQTEGEQRDIDDQIVTEMLVQAISAKGLSATRRDDGWYHIASDTIPDHSRFQIKDGLAEFVDPKIGASVTNISTLYLRNQAFILQGPLAVATRLTASIGGGAVFGVSVRPDIALSAGRRLSVQNEELGGSLWGRILQFPDGTAFVINIGESLRLQGEKFGNNAMLRGEWQLAGERPER